MVHVFLGLLLFFLFTTTFSTNAYIAKTYTAREVVIFAEDICPICPQDKERWELQQEYIHSLRNRLKYKHFKVTYLISFDDYQNLNEIYRVLDIPYSMQVSELIVIIDENAVFINFIPVEIITEFLEDYVDSYDRFIISKDKLQPLQYEIILGESREINRCRIESSLRKCMEEIINTHIISSPSFSLGTLTLLGIMILICGLIITYFKVRSNQIIR